MIADTLKYVLSNVPLSMFVTAMLIATVVRRPAPVAARCFAWLLLLSVGVVAVLSFCHHQHDAEIVGRMVAMAGLINRARRLRPACKAARRPRAARRSE